MACNARTHEISGRRHHNLLVCPMKDSWSWLHMSTRTTDTTYLKNFCQSIQKQYQEEGKEKKNLNCKAFCVTRKRNKIWNRWRIDDLLTDLCDCLIWQLKFVNSYLIIQNTYSEVYSKSIETSKLELFMEIVNDWPGICISLCILIFTLCW